MESWRILSCSYLLSGPSEIGNSKFINAYKSASSRLIKKTKFCRFRRTLKNFCSDNFRLLMWWCTPSAIRQYIETQGENGTHLLLFSPLFYVLANNLNGCPPHLTPLQNISFQSFCRISGYSFLINRLLALLYALINLLSSDFGWARNMI